LAIAAALEDEHYPIDELILHLANLRAGHRFEVDADLLDRKIDTTGSERLAAACRETYGAVDHEGYLSLGLPVGYGEGAAEVVAALQDGKIAKVLSSQGELGFGPGDVERALIEWLSLLRHLRHAPKVASERWEALKAEAKRQIDLNDRVSPLASLPVLPTSLLQKAPQHGIHRRRTR
ncbi:MAG: hypothetical protein AAF236_13350, partial [Verrucomicrobiota bacterium]